MVFLSRGRNRGANRGRGRGGVGEVSFESQSSHGDERDSRNPDAENVRITVGNDLFRDRHDDRNSGHVSSSVSQRLGPHAGSFDRNRERDAVRRPDADHFRHDAEIYGHVDIYDRERDRDQDRYKEPYNRDPYIHPEEREYGDRRGLGAVSEHQFTSVSSHLKKASSGLPSASRSPDRVFPIVSSASSSVQSSGFSRPLKSILKKKDQLDSPPTGKPDKSSGLPGIAHYMDDIEDEDKFLYGDDDKDGGRHGSSSNSQQLPSESELHLSMRSAAELWQPSVPAKSASAILPEFVGAQHSYTEPLRGQQSYQSQQQVSSSVPINEGEGLWTMLAKSVQTVKQQSQSQSQFPVQQQQQNQFNLFQEGLQSATQFPFTSQPSHSSATQTPVAQPSIIGAAHDPTIENILKSIGFDFEMSKRMQEKAKQIGGELPTPKVVRSDDPQFGINQTASFFGSQISHEEMKSQLGPPSTEGSITRDVSKSLAEQSNLSWNAEQREQFNYSGNQDILSRERDGDPSRGEHSELQRGCSPISNDRSPPPMFNLPPITIKRRSNLNRNRSPGWDRSLRSVSNSPGIESGKQMPRSRSKSPSWTESHGRKTSPLPRSLSPIRNRSPPARARSPVQRSLSPVRNRSPVTRVRSPIIMRTFNVDINPNFRKRASPGVRQKSPVVHHSRSPVRRHSRSPLRRISRSPKIHRISRSPGIKSSRSPIGRRRSRSPVSRKRTSRGRSPRKRSSSPRERRHSLSPRGKKRGFSPRPSRSRERKIRRSTSRERYTYRSGGAARRRSISGDRASVSRQLSRSSGSPRIERSLSLSSDSDPDGPANKEYFSSPLRLPGSKKRYYDDRPLVHGQSALDFSAPPPHMFSPPHRFPLGMPPRSMPQISVIPTCMPPPGIPLAPTPYMMGANIGPPPLYGFPLSGTQGLAGPFSMLPPNMMGPIPTQDVQMVPPETLEMPLHVPSRPNLTTLTGSEFDLKPENTIASSMERPKDVRSDWPRSEEQKTDDRENSSLGSSRTFSSAKPRSKAEDQEINSSVPQRVVMIGESTISSSMERHKNIRSDRSRSRERKTDREKSSSGSSRIFPSAKSRSKGEEQEINTSVSQRVVMISGTRKSSSAKNESSKKYAEKKQANVPDKAKIFKEKDSLDSKIKLLETEYGNLRKQEAELKKRPSGKDGKQDPILAENNKLLEEIRKEIRKLKQHKHDFEKKHAQILKESSMKRDLKVTPVKETTTKRDDKGKDTGKSESGKSQEFKIEKGRLMRHHFVDQGQHWCKECKTVSQNIHDYVQHLASYKHKQTLSVDHRPWREGLQPYEGMIVNKNGINVPLPGTEFLMPVQGYYCVLCKVFLGDVSCGVDHFRCESHYFSYKKYCKDNPIYERKYKEEKAAFLSDKENDKATESGPKKLTMAEVREQEKIKKMETECQTRDNEKMWEKTAEDLDDVGQSFAYVDKAKRPLKYGPRDKKESEKVSEKGFGIFASSRPGEQSQPEEKMSEEQDKDKSDDKSDKGKININLNLSGKNIISKAGAVKRNSLLPTWGPVGKKASGLSAKLDAFLTSTTGDGKIPVITDKPEKRKISAKDILKAFTGRKEKEKTKSESESETFKEDTKDENIVEAITDKANKSKDQLIAENEKRIMGINPDDEVPLAEIKPPPPRSQTVPLPDQKPSSTFAGLEVHKVYYADTTIDLHDIPIPRPAVIEKSKEIVSDVTVCDLNDIPFPEGTKKNEKTSNANNNVEKVHKTEDKECVKETIAANTENKEFQEENYAENTECRLPQTLDKYEITVSDKICSEIIEKTGRESVTEEAQNIKSISIDSIEETVQTELEILQKMEHNSEKAENNDSENRRIVSEVESNKVEPQEAVIMEIEQQYMFGEENVERYKAEMQAAVITENEQNYFDGKENVDIHQARVTKNEQKFMWGEENVEDSKSQFQESSINQSLLETEVEKMFVGQYNIEQFQQEKYIESENRNVQETLEPESDQKYVQNATFDEKEKAGIVESGNREHVGEILISEVDEILMGKFAYEDSIKAENNLSENRECIQETEIADIEGTYFEKTQKHDSEKRSAKEVLESQIMEISVENGGNEQGNDIIEAENVKVSAEGIEIKNEVKNEQILETTIEIKEKYIIMPHNDENKIIDEETSRESHFEEMSAENEGTELGKYMDEDIAKLSTGKVKLCDTEKFEAMEITDHESITGFDQAGNVYNIEENLDDSVMGSYVDNTVNKDNYNEECVEKTTNNANEEMHSEEIRVKACVQRKAVEIPAVKEHSMPKRGKRAVKKGKIKKSIEILEKKGSEMEDVENLVSQEYFTTEHAVVAQVLKEPVIVSDKSEDEEAIEPDTTSVKRCRGRGRGRGRGHGRGAKSPKNQTVTRSTRSTRQSKAAEFVVVPTEIIHLDSESASTNQDCVVTVKDNKNFEMTSSVHNGNKSTISSSGDKPIKISIRRRVQSSPFKVESVPADNDTSSEVSGERNNFEVVGDFDDKKL